MLKKRVLKLLLPLLFSFCCVFSGFLSVNAFAYSGYDNFPCDIKLNFSFYNGSSIVSNATLEPNKDNNIYYFGLPNPHSNVNDIVVYTFDSLPWNIANVSSVFDYYLITSLYGSASSISSFTFFPTILTVQANDHNNSPINLTYTDLNYYHTDTVYYKGFSTSCKLDLSSQTALRAIGYSGNGSVPQYLYYEASIIAIPKGLTNGDVQQAIVNAINNQTSQLSSDIGQAADDVQQSIEDQYSGEPEDEFSVDDVITQHNEKMGVLSFGSDVMLQFLDMFQSANVGTAELTLPGFNITVENVEYSVWPDYSFNFEQLNDWVPALMSVIRIMLPAFVWLMVLRYCINVFEKNFLSNGG